MKQFFCVIKIFKSSNDSNSFLLLQKYSTSIKTSIVDFLLSISSVIYSVNSSIASKVDLPVQSPSWLTINILFLQIKSLNFTSKSLFFIFGNWGNIENGL